MQYPLPHAVEAVLAALENAGYEAYLVGGCVRDHLMGRTPQDYDITTSALPEQTLQVFSHLRVIETGLKHGTVTVVCEGMPLEITTYRTDGSYSDSRRPDSVQFTRSLREDLARRDLTVNAMAMDRLGNITDPFGGCGDIKAKLLRTVGDADTRYAEDALRILRTLRFASKLGFCIESATEAALLRGKEHLHRISAERIFSELTALLMGDGARDVLVNYFPIISTVLPELAPMYGMQQYNPYHIYDVWQHTAAVVDAAPKTPALRWAALLHDCEKPSCFHRDEKGIGHFYGHAQKSAKLADKILRRLKASNALREEVCALIDVHDDPMPLSDKVVRKRLSKLGEERFFRVLQLKEADSRGQNPEKLPASLQHLEALRQTAERLLQTEGVITVATLAVNGADLMALGLSGKAIGKAQQNLLTRVLDGKLKNNREALLKAAKQNAPKKPAQVRE